MHHHLHRIPRSLTAPSPERQGRTIRRYRGRGPRGSEVGKFPTSRRRRGLHRMERRRGLAGRHRSLGRRAAGSCRSKARKSEIWPATRKRRPGAAFSGCEACGTGADIARSRRRDHRRQRALDQARQYGRARCAGIGKVRRHTAPGICGSTAIPRKKSGKSSAYRARQSPTGLPDSAKWRKPANPLARRRTSRGATSSTSISGCAGAPRRYGPAYGMSESRCDSPLGGHVGRCGAEAKIPITNGPSPNEIARH